MIALGPRFARHELTAHGCTLCRFRPAQASAPAEEPALPAGHTGRYSVEYAKSGRAKCKVCGELIELRSLRVGIEVEEKGWGIITRWQHIDCTRLPRSVATAEALEDFDSLLVPDQARRAASPLLSPHATCLALATCQRVGGSTYPNRGQRLAPRPRLTHFSLPGAQVRVREMLAATDAPKHLKEVDPDAEIAEAAQAWTKQREPPEALLAPMLPYQKEGLGWMCAQVSASQLHPPPPTRAPPTPIPDATI